MFGTYSPPFLNLTQKLNLAQVTVPGTSGGTVTYQMPWRAPNYKIFTVYLNGYENDTATSQVITFPVAYTFPPVVISSVPGLTITVTSTNMTIVAPNNTTLYTGWLIIEGY